MDPAVASHIDSLRSTVVELQRELTARPSIPPNNGGDGEHARAEYLQEWLEKQEGVLVERFDAPDERVSTGVRPNLVVTLPGEDRSKSAWIIGHLDIVPPGDRGAWNSDPHKMVEQDGKLFGRGVEDNQQGVVAGIVALLALRDLNLTPKNDMKLLLAADEESGSDKGVKFLLAEHPEIFGPDDEFLVPDGGEPDGSAIQIAEKNIYILKFTTTGKQTHAARPDTGVNAFVAGSELVVELNGLNEYFSPISDDKFTPPTSTFVPSRKDPNVSAANIMPGEDRFSMDCRILPRLEFEKVEKRINEICQTIERKYGVKISWEITIQKSTGETAEDAPIVSKLRTAIETTRNIKVRTIGIGGGTIAGDFRKVGRDAVMWATVDGTAHMPNEYCILDNLLADAKVFCAYCLQ